MSDTLANSKPTPRWAIRLSMTAILLPAVYLAIVFGVTAIVGVPADSFESIVGLDWTPFASSNPEVAGYIDDLARLYAVASLGLISFAAVVVWTRLRDFDSWAVKALWIFPLSLGFQAAAVFDPDQPEAAIPQFILALIAAAGVFSAGRQLAATTKKAVA